MLSVPRSTPKGSAVAHHPAAPPSPTAAQTASHNHSAITTAARGLVASHMVDAADEALATAQRATVSLIAQRQLPTRPWSEPEIELFLRQLAMMDTNNFAGHAGGGEREGRVLSSLVARRHFFMTHGIGRSGDVTADQPKAAGSSLLAKLANGLALDAIRLRGITSAEAAVVVPLATGMTLALCLQAVRQTRPATAKYVVWPRIDQKTSIKCIVAAGLTPYPVELREAQVFRRRNAARAKQPYVDPVCLPCGNEHVPPRQGAAVPGPSQQSSADELMEEAAAKLCLEVHADDVAKTIDALGADNVVCVMSTTSCFCPRLPDDVLTIARVSKDRGVPVVVNNAYGLQSGYSCRRLNAALDEDLVKYVVQSTDKNFLVPVGGAVVIGSKRNVAAVSSLYPGRAAAATSVDMVVTLLEIGRPGWLKLHDDRECLRVNTFLPRLRAFAAARGETVATHIKNDISAAVTLNNLPGEQGNARFGAFGAALFRRRVTGPKVIIPLEDLPPPAEGVARRTTRLCGCSFQSYGTHSNTGTTPMLVVACAVGMRPAEVDTLFERLEELYPAPGTTFTLVVDAAQ